MTDAPGSSDGDDRHSRLLGIKLRALVIEHLGREPDSVDIGAFPGGAALVADGAAWVLIDGPAARSLGGALAWALRRRAASLNVIAESDTGLLARRAARLAFPVSIWFAQERTLLRAVGEPLPACLLYTSPSPRDRQRSRMPSSA